MEKYQEMPLPDEILKALRVLKFTEPTKIQSAVIPVAMSGHDIMACAETGSGKTAAYGIPMVTKLLDEPESTALILAPTRELAQQITEFLRQLTNECKNLKVACLVGGADIRKQLNALKKRPRIVVATPGRLTDHLKRRSVKLNKTSILVLDEGDRMLDMGFQPQLDIILEYVPKERQTSLFTATLPEKVQRLCRNYLSHPKKISVGQTSLPVKTVKQSVVQVKFKEKDDRIIDELNQREGSIIVFARTKNRTDILAKILHSYGFSVGLIHGGRTQGQRNVALQNFRKGKSRILCATDVAARGIDVPQVEHVINYDLPVMDEDYVHRIGRTARNGAEGEAVSFVTPDQHRDWMALVRKYKISGVELEGVSKSQTHRRGEWAKPGKKKKRLSAKSSARGSSSRRGESRREEESRGGRRRDEERSGRRRDDEKRSRRRRDDEPRAEKPTSESRKKALKASKGKKLGQSSFKKKKTASKKFSGKKSASGKKFSKKGGFKAGGRYKSKRNKKSSQGRSARH